LRGKDWSPAVCAVSAPGARTVCVWSCAALNFSTDSGAIREAGGSFAKREKAEEERYFRERTKEQLAALKKHHEEEINHHKREIERLQKEIERHKQNIKKLKDHGDD
ncbi:PREDICTED: ATPase inhibitor, mitochondrial, partial [Myotis davidii]|uniref:ATPase inhibitor, mitochondrial n=1 Tax=Myotis davidii TaxID=225400 RepID=UPI0003EC2C7E